MLIDVALPLADMVSCLTLIISILAELHITTIGVRAHAE